MSTAVSLLLQPVYSPQPFETTLCSTQNSSHQLFGFCSFFFCFLFINQTTYIVLGGSLFYLNKMHLNHLYHLVNLYWIHSFCWIEFHYIDASICSSIEQLSSIWCLLLSLLLLLLLFYRRLFFHSFLSISTAPSHYLMLTKVCNHCKWLWPSLGETNWHISSQNWLNFIFNCYIKCKHWMHLYHTMCCFSTVICFAVFKLG